MSAGRRSVVQNRRGAFPARRKFVMTGTPPVIPRIADRNSSRCARNCGPQLRSMTAILRVRCVFPFWVACALFAQSARADAAIADRSLNLTSQQEAEINQLSRAERESFLAIVRDPVLAEDQRLAKAARVHRAFVAAIEALLSPSQVAKSRLPLEPVRSWPWPGSIVSERLPGEQRKQLDALAQEAIQAHNDIVGNVALSELQKRMAVEAKEREVRERFRALLTPAQRTLLPSAVRIEIASPLLAVNP